MGLSRCAGAPNLIRMLNVQRESVLSVQKICWNERSAEDLQRNNDAMPDRPAKSEIAVIARPLCG